ncbi:MAG: trypsin-like peptidase domain-containing protein [Planctomycetota bacterium]
MDRKLLLLVLLAMGAPLHLRAESDGERRAAMRKELDLIAERVQLDRAFNLIHELVQPSVVSIHISQTRWQIDRLRDVDVGEGSGFIFHSTAEASYVLTNAHVVLQMNQDREFIRDRNNAPMWYDAIRATTARREQLRVHPVGADTDTDLAVLRIERGDMPEVSWGDSDAVRVGDYVVALGYPLRVGYSATFGNISATDKSTAWFRREGGYAAFLQTDAAINPGNSGGPLVDLHGEVIGVNASIVSRGGGNIGIGFAIPARLARRVAEDLRRHGRVHRPVIGIQMDDSLDPAEIRRLAVPNPDAVRIALVWPGSPAEQAGLRDGDMVLSVDGVPVEGIQQFRARVAAARLGQPLELELWRDGERIERTLVPVSQEELDVALREQAVAGTEKTVSWPAYGLVLGENGHRGVVIAEVTPDSPAAGAGLHAGDRILRVYDLGPVNTLDDVANLGTRPELVLLVYHAGHPWLVRLSR